MFVLAHLSDPHLAPLPQPRWSELAGKRATGYVNWRRTRHLIHRGEVLARVLADLRASAPGHIAVTGDLVNISLADEYAPARAWLESLGSPAEVTLVPGNHDAYVRGAARHFCSQWGDYMRGDDLRGHDLQGDDLRGEIAFPFLRRRGPLALIGLSSAVATAPFMATGRLGHEQIGRLPKLLDRAHREGLFRVVLIHHPPLSSARRHFKRLTDGAKFRAVLKEHGAELVIHGHDHVHSLIYLEGSQHPIPALGAPSASQAPRAGHDAAGYNLCRIEGQPGAWRCEIVVRGLAHDGETMGEIRRIALG
jgi:3',5'-cyclic AMP phosphodiesterase CpdA